MGLFRRSKPNHKPDATAFCGVDESTNFDEGAYNRSQRKRSVRRGEQPHQQDRFDRSGDEERFDQYGEDSVGEDLAQWDQFDLYVPIKAPRRKGILRNPGTYGVESSYHHPLKARQFSRYDEMESYGGIDGTSTVSSLSTGTYDNSMDIQYSPSQGPIWSAKVRKAPTRRHNKTTQQREQDPQKAVGSETPEPPCNNACCAHDEDKFKHDLRGGDRSLAGGDAAKEEEEERDPVEAREKVVNSRRNGPVSATKSHPSHPESQLREGGGDNTADITSPTKTGNDVVTAGIIPGTSPPPTTNISNNGSFPMCILGGLCGPREVSDVAISDEILSTSTVVPSPRSGAFRSYQRPSAPHPAGPSSTFRSVPSLFDPTLREDEMDDRHNNIMPSGVTSATATTARQQSRPEQERQKHPHHHRHSGDRRYSNYNDNINAAPTEEGLYDDEGLTTYAVVELDSRRDRHKQRHYGWWGDDVASTDEQIDGDGHYTRKLTTGDTDDAASGWKQRLPRVRSIPKIGKFVRPRSFQRKPTNNTGDANAVRHNSAAVSRGRSRTVEKSAAAVTSPPTGDPGDTSNNHGKSNGGRRRSRSRSRSRSRAAGRHHSVTSKVRKSSSRLPAGKEIDPRDLW